MGLNSFLTLRTGHGSNPLQIWLTIMSTRLSVSPLTGFRPLSTFGRKEGTDMPDTTEALKKDRAEDEVFIELKRAILLGDLRPRERLLEAELAERFGVGRHTVRVALETLDRVGLIERKANKGATVRDYDEAEIEALYEMRQILQTAAIKRFSFPVSEEVIARLVQINQIYREGLEARDLATVIEANDEFHSTLFGACGNAFLDAEIEEYWLKTAAIHCHAIARPAMAEQSLKEHEQMIEALRNQDRAALETLCTDHMYPALEAYKEARHRW